MNVFALSWSFIKSALHAAGSPTTSGKISASPSGVFSLGRASGMSGISGRGGSVLGGVIGGGVGTGTGGWGRLNLGVSNGKSGNPRTRRLRRQTQGSRLSLYVEEALTVRGYPRQVTLVTRVELERASMLHSQEDMVGVMRKKANPRLAPHQFLYKSYAPLPEKRVG